MTLRPSHSSRARPAALGVRWLVLAVILFGTILSSVGGTHSHGIAALSAALHVAPMPPDASHGHSHEDDDSTWAAVSAGAVADHPHHGSDHSHDKAGALPAAWRSAAPPLPAWFGLVRPWIETVRASRLERPPMG